MKTIILVNQKGGVAKTTSTANLSAVKAKQGSTVLMIDLDPQASLTIASGIEPGEERLEGHSSCDLFDNRLDPFDSIYKVTSSGLENLYIIPSNITLSETEQDLIHKMNREVKLKKAIAKLAPEFDYIFIDCPPQLGQLSINALVAADELLIPCKTDYLAYRGLKALTSTIEQIIEEDMNPNLKTLGIIATFYESNIKDQRAILDMMDKVIPIIGTVRKSTDICRNLVRGNPAVLALPNSKVAEEYTAIANKI